MKFSGSLVALTLFAPLLAKAQRLRGAMISSTEANEGSFEDETRARELAAPGTLGGSEANDGSFADETLAQEVVAPRIVGGTISKQHGFFVQGFGCGASLVAPDVVLTAAHCIRAFPVNSTVMVGNTKSRTLTAGSQERRLVGSPVLHPQWNSGTMQYDLMMFKIQQVTEAGLTPIALNRDTTVPIKNQAMTAVGFGATSQGGAGSPDLLTVNLKAVPDAECTSMVMAHDLHDQSMVCAGGDEGFDTCQGDSGGPLFVAQSEESDNVLVGLTSWGDGCAARGRPGVYAEVSTNIKWIQDTICSLTDTRPSFCLGHKDGTVCRRDGSPLCLYCRNRATYWYSKASMACGIEPCLTTGFVCQDDTACNKCCNGHSWKADENQGFFTACD